MSRLERWSPLASVLAVVLWIVGLALQKAPDTSTKKSDAEILAVYQHNANRILLASWLFMLGCICFLWFAGIVRARLADAEGVRPTFASLAFGGAVASAVFGIGTMAGPVGVAINKDDISASAASALTHLGDVFFVGTEFALIVLFAAVAAVAFQTRLFPRWWAALLVLVAVVLVIGPIGWAAVIFATPIWTLVTAWMLMRSNSRRVEIASAAA